MHVRPIALVVLAVIAVGIVSTAPAAAQTRETDDITLPRYTGYISVAPEGRYFVDEAGQGFIVIGENDAVSWPGLVTLVDRSSALSTERYIMDLREHGVTVSRIMLGYAEQPFSYLENPVGSFSPSIVQFWDDFFPMAEEHGLYLLLTPYDTFWQARNWARYPYSASMGGPCEEMHDWLTDRACIDAQKNRWRFVIDRWGDSPSIFAWDIMNEIDIWWEASPEEVKAYVDEMAAFIREYEMERWGKAHMLTVSSAAANPTGKLGEIIYQHPLLDFANTHQYLGPAVNDPGGDTISAAPAVAQSTAQSLAAITDSRPYFDSESGPIDGWIADFDVDAEYHHNMAWAHLMAGGAGVGMRWPYSFPHWIMPKLRDNLLGVARFASTVDWSHFSPRNINQEIAVDQPYIIRVGCAQSSQALIWLLVDSRQDNPPTLAEARITLDGVLTDGSYTVEFWETYGGELLDQMEVEVSDGVFSVLVPESTADLKDVALHIYAHE
jgi:hypothetical protein